MRPALSIHAPERRRAARPSVERWLDAFGAESTLTDSVLGDLAEERAERASRDGEVSANWWYLREAIRSAPWLAANALHRAGWRARTAFATMILATAALVSMIVLNLAGDPERMTGIGDHGDGIVVNNVKPVKLGVRVLDARGHVLPDSAVRYQLVAGAPVHVSPQGVLTCTQRGDATVRATLGALVTDLALHCWPVQWVFTGGVELIVGEEAAPVPIMAVDASHHVVTQLRGAISVADTTIVRMISAPSGVKLLVGRAAGSTRLDITIGDQQTSMWVDAYRRAPSPTEIKPGDMVAVRLDLQSREFRGWTLPASREVYGIRMLPHGDEANMPLLAIVGANCVPRSSHGFACAAPHGATVYAYYPMSGNQTGELRGDLAVSRARYP